MQELITPTQKSAGAQFRNFLATLIAKFEPLRIICFSSQSLSYELKGCFGAATDKHVHYCLLIITGSKCRIDYEIQDYCNSHFYYGRISILCHSKEAVNEAIEANSRFFIQVLQNGELIYAADGLLSDQDLPEFNPGQSVIKARKHWKHRMPLAEGFLEGAGIYLDKGQYNLSVFMMHQSVEQCCSLLVRIVMGYRADFHNIQRLLFLCRCFSEEPFKLFITGTESDAKLFDLLVKSYSQARYSGSFLVDQEDVKLLFARVTSFLELVKVLCSKKIDELQHCIEVYQKGESEKADV